MTNTATYAKRKRRRAAGEGCIYQRERCNKNGKKMVLWVGEISTGPRKSRKRKVIYGRTPVEVRDELTRLRNRLASGQNLRAEKRLTVAQYLENWHKSTDRWKPKTRRYYADLIHLHINPAVGAVQLSRLQPSDVRAMLEGMEANGRSASMRRKAVCALSTALGDALREELVVRNICNSVRKPRVPRVEINAMTQEQINAFLGAARADRLYALYVLALSTGLRFGELLGLQRKDVDLKAGYLSVCHTLIPDEDGNLELATTKTRGSRRKIDLSPSVVRVLHEHRERALALGRSASPYLFCDRNGKPLRQENVRRRSYEKILERAKLPHFRFHDLRHSAASLLLAQGVPAKVVQERLGHSSIKTTLDVYAHVTPTMQRDAAEKVEEALKDALA